MSRVKRISKVTGHILPPNQLQSMMIELDQSMMIELDFIEGSPFSATWGNWVASGVEGSADN